MGWGGGPSGQGGGAGGVSDQHTCWTKAEEDGRCSQQAWAVHLKRHSCIRWGGCGVVKRGGGGRAGAIHGLGRKGGQGTLTSVVSCRGCTMAGAAAHGEMKNMCCTICLQRRQTLQSRSPTCTASSPAVWVCCFCCMHCADLDVGDHTLCRTEG